MCCKTLPLPSCLPLPSRTLSFLLCFHCLLSAGQCLPSPRVPYLAAIRYDASLHVKLCDFAFSKVKELEAEQAYESQCGTPAWMAPEVLRGSPYSLSADTFCKKDQPANPISCVHL